MTNHLVLGLVSLIVTVDNALLCGLLLPHAERQTQKEIATIVGIALGFAQSLMALGIGRLLHNEAFRLFTIVMLVWMCIKTMTKQPMRQEVNKWAAAGTVFLCSLLGDLGNTIWLGSVMHGNYVALILFVICFIPVFVVVSLFLAEQSAKYDWVLFLGAALMAWIAGSLCIETEVGRMLAKSLSPLLVQVLFTALLMALAAQLRRYGKMR